eukprot:359014-Chlamydomonas_euryale.AAC.16
MHIAVLGVIGRRHSHHGSTAARGKAIAAPAPFGTFLDCVAPAGAAAGRCRAIGVGVHGRRGLPHGRAGSFNCRPATLPFGALKPTSAATARQGAALAQQHPQHQPTATVYMDHCLDMVAHCSRAC